MREPTAWLVRGDLSQIEARVLPWLAGAEWTMDAFRAYDAGTGPDLYRVSAAGIFRVPIEEIPKTDERRQVGKVASLSLQFQGGANALQTMAQGAGAKIPWHPRLPARHGEKFGRCDFDAEVVTGSDEWIKRQWRASNPEIADTETGLWKAAENAAVQCLASPAGDRFPFGPRGLAFYRDNSALAMELPSGRFMLYWQPRLVKSTTPWGKDRWAVRYRAEDSQTKQWHEWTAYGGILCQGPTQATARDIICVPIVRAEAAGLQPVLTVHDEVVARAPRDRFPTQQDAIAAMERLMTQDMPAWTAGLPIAADASAATRYLKG